MKKSNIVLIVIGALLFGGITGMSYGVKYVDEVWLTTPNILIVLGIILTIVLAIGYSISRYRRLKREAKELARKIESINESNIKTLILRNK